MSTIPRIVLSGGPCAGKTTAMAVLRQKLAAFGVRVFVVPELATELFTNGINPGELFQDAGKWADLQSEMIRAQIIREEYWERIANLSGDEPKVMICDRGIMDQAAYIEREKFDGILHDLRLSLSEVRDERYLAVLHLVTSARGAEEAYTLANNAARRETVEEAQQRDLAGLAAWQGHRNLVIVPNTRRDGDGVERKISFDEKLEHVLQAACQLLSLPVPSRVERKYLVSPSWQWPAKGVDAEIATQLIEQIYLTAPEGLERRIRRMTPEGRVSRPGSLYIYTEKKWAPDGGRVVTERPLTAREFETLRLEADKDTEVIHKRRHTFVWRDQYFQLDEGKKGEPYILEATQTMASEGVILPPWIPIEREVTGDRSWVAREQARKPVVAKATIRKS